MNEMIPVSWESFEQPKGRFVFEWSKNVEVDRDIERVAQELLENGVAYLQEVGGDEYPVSKQFHIVFTPREGHGAQGALMHLSAERLRDFDSKDTDLEQSLIIHELVHNLRDEEDLPMLIEIIYLLERDHRSRLDEIRTLFEQEKLSQPYVDGLHALARMTGMTIEEFLSASSQHIDTLKDAFRTEVAKILQELNTTQ